MDIATIGIRVQTEGLEAGAQGLEKLAAAGSKAEKSVEGVASGATAASRATDSAAQATARAAAATERSAAAASKGASSYGAFAAGQKLNAYQAQQLGFQLNDLFVQITSGQSPLTALIQQGSQLSGTFGGIGGTFRALATVFTPFRLAIGGVVGAIATLGASYITGAQQSADFAKAITLTGNAAGITEGQFNSLAKTIASSTGTAIGGARETLQSLVASGRFSGAALESTARATQGLARVTGQSSDEIVKDFVAMSDGVAKWAEKTNERYNFLTAAQLQYVKTLEDQGNSQRAIQTVMDALNGRLDQTASQLGTLERLWNRVKSAASGAVNAMLEVGRVSTPEDNIRTLESQLAALDARRSSNPALTDARRKAIQEQLDGAREVARLGARSATEQAQTARLEQDRITFNKVLENSLTRQEQRTKEIARVNALADKAGASAADRAKAIAAVEERFKGPKGPKETATRPELKDEIAEIARDLNALTNAYQNAESILEATRSAGLVQEGDYYDAKRAFIELDRQARRQAMLDEIQVIEAAKITGSDAIDIQNQRLENEKKIADLKARVAILDASAAAKQTVLDTQRASAAERIKKAYEDAAAAAKNYVDTITRQNARELEAIGKGAVERERLARRNQRDDQFQQRKDSLDQDLRRNQIQKPAYDELLALEKQAHERILADDDRFYAERLNLQGNWINGATEALQNYVDQSKDIASGVQEIFSNAFRGAEDELTNLFTDKKFDLKGLFDSINADIVRQIVRTQITGPMAEALQEGIKSGGGLGGSIGDYFTGLFGGGRNNAPKPENPLASGIQSIFGGKSNPSPALSGLSTAATTAAEALSRLTYAAAGSSANGASGFGSLLSSAQAAFSGTSAGASGFGTGLAYGNMDFGGFFAEGGKIGAGQFGVTGERGPELVAGPATIIPMDRLFNSANDGGSRSTNNIVVNVPESYSRDTAAQIAGRTARELSRARA